MNFDFNVSVDTRLERRSGVQQTISFSRRAYCEGCFNYVMIHANVGEIAQCCMCEEYRMVSKYSKSVFDTPDDFLYGLRGPRVDL